MTDQGAAAADRLYDRGAAVRGKRAEVAADSGIHAVNALRSDLNRTVLRESLDCAEKMCFREILHELDLGRIVLFQCFLRSLDNKLCPVLDRCDAVDTAELGRNVKAFQIQKNVFHDSRLSFRLVTDQ